MNAPTPDPNAVELPKAEEAEQLRLLISTLMHEFLVSEKRYPPAGGAMNYNPHDFHTLKFIAANPGCRASQLTAFLAVSPTTATSVVDRLARRKLVKRSKHAEDGRAVALNLTEEGAALATGIVTQDRVNMTAILSALEPAERTDLLNLLTKVSAHLTEDRISPAD